MSIAHALFLLPPFHGGGRREIIRRPKCYAFDTGFVVFVKGWESIREEDRGFLWEHLVLDELRTIFDDRNLYFWKDKSGREVDFVVKGSDQRVDAIECKINPDKFNPDDLGVLRSVYSKGRNWVLSPAIKTPYQRRCGKMLVQFSSLMDSHKLSGGVFLSHMKDLNADT
jgi:predicted AAA+ superfamily ATPase